MKEIYEEATNQSKMMCEAQKEEIFNNTLKENKKLNQEIERLTAESTKWESKFYDEAKKVDRAIEYIEKNVWSCYILDDEKELIETDSEELLEILKGVDKE